MADPTTPHRPGTRAAPDVPPSGGDQDVAASSTCGLASLGSGALGVVFAILPSLGVVALLFAVVALGVGVPAMRRGPGAPGFPYARVGVVLGMIGVLLGILSLVVQLL